MAFDELEERVSALEKEVRDLSGRVRGTEQDAAAARVLAGGADRDVSEIRTEIRDLRQAGIGSFNAMREIPSTSEDTSTVALPRSAGNSTQRLPVSSKSSDSSRPSSTIVGTTSSRRLGAGVCDQQPVSRPARSAGSRRPMARPGAGHMTSDFQRFYVHPRQGSPNRSGPNRQWSGDCRRGYGRAPAGWPSAILSHP